MKKLFKKLNVTSVLMLVLCAVLGVMDSSAYVAGGVVNTTPIGSKVISGNPQTIPSAPQGLDTPTVTENAQDLLMQSINEQVVKVRPAYTPFDTILRQAKAKKAESWEFAWYSTDLMPVATKVASISLELANHSGGYKNATLTVDDSSLFNESDTICIHTQSNGNLILLVVAKNTATGALTVAYGGENVPVANVTADDDVYRLGRAGIEGEIQTINYSALPVKETNYCQIFKWQVAQSTLEKLHKKEVKWDMSDIEEQAMCEFKIAQEASFLFSRKTKYYNSAKGAEVYSTGGIVNYITKHFEFDATKGNAEIVDMSKYIFQGNIGNRKRVMFMGSDFNAAIAKINMFQKQLASTETKVVFGLEFNELRTNFGTLMCMQHDLLDLYGYKDKAIVIDIDNVDKWEWVKEMRNIDTKTSGTFDGEVKVYTEIAGVALRYPDTHCVVSLAATSVAGGGSGSASASGSGSGSASGSGIGG